MQARWYFDFVSPFAYLQLPKVLEWCKRIDITPVPIVFGAVLTHHGQLGPAEIAGKREFTYRFVQWLADREGTALRFPPAHPFNSLAALRLCVAADARWDAITAIFDHVWRDGRSGAQAIDLDDVARSIGIDDVVVRTADNAVKAKLRANTTTAIEDGIFGVPTLAIGGELFWGNDASPMIETFIDEPALLDTEEQRRIAALPRGVERAR
jgi:2-hydroxychromene-2-carboxylate isomerase